jgi:chromosome segregation ATPase
MKTLILSTVVALILSPMAAAQSTSADETMRVELARMDASLKEIARALKQQAETQQADLLLKRVTLSLTQFAAGEERLKRIDQETRTLRDEDAEMQTSLKMLTAKSATPETSATPHRDQIGEINSRVSTIQERLATLNEQRIETQNEIERLRSDAREWQAALDKFLSSRP